MRQPLGSPSIRQRIVALLYQDSEPGGSGFVSLLRATLEHMKSSAASTIPTAEKPALSDEQRAARLQLLAERLVSSEGLDRDTLARIEQLTGEEQ
jgi:hypothetical protein